MSTTTLDAPGRTADRPETTPRLKAYHVYIKLADGEYQCGRRLPDGAWEACVDNMRAAAREVFDAHPDKPDMVAHVTEHGGWSLAYAKNGMVIGSANDRALYSDEVREYRALLRGAEWAELPAIRR